MNTENDINRKRLLWAGFVAILAAGIGFGVRGGIFSIWAENFSFSGAQLGLIGGAGFTGFCFGIVIGGVIVDKIGYGKLVFAAFLFHIVSALVTFGATEGQDTSLAFQFLFWGTFIFALANGTLEAVANPLVSTLFPENRTHNLNILHASWPLGMVIGGLIGRLLGSGENAMGWKMQLGLYMIPVLIYGWMFFGQRYPKSEASEKGLSFGDMFKEVGLLSGAVVCFMLGWFAKSTMETFFQSGDATSSLPLIVGAIVGIGLFAIVLTMTRGALGSWFLFFLFLTHLMVGAVELGTDGWMQNFTGVLLDEDSGKTLFIITSLFMFVLRFMAESIEKHLKVSPIGLLFLCAVIAVVGLNMIAAVNSFGFAIGAVLTYALGKTFFWPTMLAVVGDRFPATGAVAMSLMGGVGMMSAGLIGNGGLGYFKDSYTVSTLQDGNSAVYEKYVSDGASSKFPPFQEVQPVDGKALEEVKKIAADERTAEQTALVEAEVEGVRKTLKTDSLIPAAMAISFLLMFLYFRVKGGYKPLSLKDEQGDDPDIAAQAHAGEA